MLLVLVVLTLSALVWTVVFSNWNVCRADLDDDVDALNADVAAARGSSTLGGSRRRPAKICLSPETDSSGLRVNMSIDSDADLRRYNVSASATKPYTSIIHTIYTTTEIPSSWKKSAKTCVTLNKDFAHCHWSFAELEDFVADEYPWLLSTYQGYKYFIQRCDVARYVLLYRYGGTYVDLDLTCRTSLSVVYATTPVEAGVVVAPTLPSGYAVCFIVVRRPRDPVVRGVISGLRRAAASWWYLPIPYVDIIVRSGPRYFTRRVDCHDRRDHIFEIPWSVYPEYIERVTGGSWHTWDAVIISFLFIKRYQILRLVFLLSACAAFVWVFRNRRCIANYLLNGFCQRK